MLEEVGVLVDTHYFNEFYETKSSLFLKRVLENQKFIDVPLLKRTGCVTIPLSHNSATISFNTILVFWFAMVLDFLLRWFPFLIRRFLSFRLVPAESFPPHFSCPFPKFQDRGFESQRRTSNPIDASTLRHTDGGSFQPTAKPQRDVGRPDWSIHESR